MNRLAHRLLRPLLPALLVALGGCEQLFSSPQTEVPDLAGADLWSDPATGVLTGAVCVLQDFRDPSTCKQQQTGKLRLSVEPGGAVAISDVLGNFALALPPGASDDRVLTVTDPSGALVSSTVRLPAAISTATALAVPAMSSTTLLLSLNGRGIVSEPGRGAILLWATDAGAHPQAGVRGPNLQAGSFGPFYDGALPNELDGSGPTRFRGLIAYFNLPPGSATIELQPSPGAPVRSDAFTLPIRASAITFSLAPLPPS